MPASVSILAGIKAQFPDAEIRRASGGKAHAFLNPIVGLAKVLDASALTAPEPRPGRPPPPWSPP